MNKKDIIIRELETISKKEAIEKNFFKVRAYKKVINQLKELESVTSMKDLQNIEGIGPKIRDKIQEILKTGKLKSAEKAREILKNGSSKIEIYDELLKIHGIGIVKAKELIEDYNINSIQSLIELINKKPDLLNNQQKVGLKYYFDIKEKIPRSEIEKHYKKISKIVKSINPDVRVKVVGSFRRGLEQSGDIDIIIKSPNDKIDSSKLLHKIISSLKTKDKKNFSYILEELSLGSKKFMGICNINSKSKARRIDILMTTPKEYPFALLYFTGDFNINIQLRKRANELGYKLNEYGLIPNKPGPKIELKSEKEIFNFLGYKFLQPKFRISQNLINI